MPPLSRFAFALLIASASISGCAALAPRDPLQVTVAGVESLQGQGLEMRMNVKLRVQNPNDEPLQYDGVALQMEVQGKTFATGVSDAAGVIPRFGETVIAVPVAISAFRMVRQAMDMMSAEGVTRIDYAMKGKLNRAGFSAARFTSKGQLDLPTSPTRTEE